MLSNQSNQKKIAKVIEGLSARKTLIHNLFDLGFVTENGYRFCHNQIVIVFQSREGGNYLKMTMDNGEVANFTGIDTCEHIITAVRACMQVMAERLVRFQAMVVGVVELTKAVGINWLPERKPKYSAGNKFRNQMREWDRMWEVNFRAKPLADRNLLNMWMEGDEIFVGPGNGDAEEPVTTPEQALAQLQRAPGDDDVPLFAVYEKNMVYTSKSPTKFTHLFFKYGLVSVKEVDALVTGYSDDPVANQIFRRNVKTVKYWAIKLRHKMEMEVTQ